MATKRKTSSKKKTVKAKPAKNMTEMMKNSKSRAKGNLMLTKRAARKPCRQCAQNKAEDTIMDTIGFGAKAVIGVGVLGALGNTFNNMNN
jgi:hypothetical protein